MQQNGAPPYYSRDNGFARASASKGVPEVLCEHLKVIIRNEELVIEKAIAEIQGDITALVDDKDELEGKKQDRQKVLDDSEEKLTQKIAKISELEKAIEEPLYINLEADPYKGLQEKIDENTVKLENNTSKLEELEEKRSKIETDLEAPTQAELEPIYIEGHPTSQSTRLEKWFAGLTALVLVGLVMYLFIFYASVGDRTFTVGIGNNLEKQQIIIPHALAEAWEVKDSETDRRNWFVITFPFIFLTLAILAYYCHENKAWRILIGLLTATFLIDVIIALKISAQMHAFTEGENVPYKLSENLIEVLSVLFLGFGVALLLSYGLYWFMKVWKGATPNQDIEEHLEKLKRLERNDRLIDLNALKTRIQSLEEKNRDLGKENQDYKDEIELAFKKPIEAKIACLQTEREREQEQIAALDQQVEGFQREINNCESQIEELVNSKDKQGLDVRKLEEQAHEFVSGWCEYISQTKGDLPDTEEIAKVQKLAADTLEDYTSQFRAT